MDQSVGLRYDSECVSCVCRATEKDSRSMEGKLTHEEFLAIVDELVDEVIVDLSTHTRSLPSEVKRVRKESMVVGSNIKDDGQDTVRVDTRSEGVQSSLRCRDLAM